ncbi:melatonin receptor type 1A isoform X2 [Aplysia californica]|nr:melatonin receptor type 1A isoform X2 [Aplysia californica]
MEQSHNDCVVVTDCQQLSSSGDNEMFAYPIPQWFVVVFIVASIFLIAVGVTGNALIIVVVVWYKKLRTVINVLIVNLAIKDVIALGVILPAQLWVFGREVYPFSMNLCVAFTAFSKTVIVGCMFDLTTIAVARYIYICRPRLRDRLFSSRLCLV